MFIMNASSDKERPDQKCTSMTAKRHEGYHPDIPGVALSIIKEYVEMPRLTFKNTIEKEEKEKEKFEKQKYIRMRKLLSELRNALKPNEEDDQEIDKALTKLFNIHLPSGFLYETKIISNEPLEIKRNKKRIAEIQ